MTDRFSSPITPTVGRVVLVRGGAVLTGEPRREVPGIVTRVWNDNCINIQVMNETPGGVFVSSVSFDAEDLTDHAYAAWRWMPYQVQAAKSRDPITGGEIAQGVIK